MRRKGLWFVALTVLVAGSSVWFLTAPDALHLRTEIGDAPKRLQSDAESHEGPAASMQGSSPTPPPVPEPARIAPPQSAAVPLPDPGTPLADHIVALTRRAEAGDAAAALRLYADIHICRGERLTSFNPEKHRTTAPPEPGAADFADALQRWKVDVGALCHFRLFCKGVTPTQLHHPERWLRLAADQGDRASRVRYASGAHLSIRTSLAGYEDLDHWLQNALPWLEEAVADGDPAAVKLLAEALGTPPHQRIGNLSEVTPADPARSHALWYALSRLPNHAGSRYLQKRLDETAAQLTAEQVADAHRKGAAYYAQHQLRLEAPVHREKAEDPTTKQTGWRRNLQKLPTAAQCNAEVEALLEQARAGS